MSGEDQSFVCGECVRLNRAHTPPRPDRVANPACTRCGEPTRQYVGVVVAGGVVSLTGSALVELRDDGERVPDTPGVRVVGGVELYSAAWL